ncbi:MAG: hypothetical protein EHM28_03585 [Spirochaetaceae bacterium]|nr:MAG: hypothetical protein EHM28_03585 [Spirochaetaceae bacterium]
MRKIILSGILVGIVALTGCMQDMQSLEKGNPSARHKVLVAGASSEFKNQVITKVLEALQKEDCYIKIISPDQLAAEKTTGFNAILLITPMMAGQLDGRIVKFIAGDPANPRVIVFCTSGDENHPPTDRIRSAIGKADAVTSASIASRTDERVREITDLIKKRW